MSDLRRRCLGSALRVCLLVFGLVGLLWTAITSPAFVSASPARDIIGRVMAAEHFKQGALGESLAYLEETSRSLISEPSISRAKALIRLELAQRAMGRPDGMDDGDRQIADTELDLKTSLATNPNDAFLWMLLYSVALTRNGFDPANIKYLAASYRIGPCEGWLALRRNRITLGLFPFLDGSLRRVAISEFAQIVDAGFSSEAALILKGVGWAHREELLPALVQANLVSRENLYRRLAADGLKLRIPDVPYDERPWR
ncbi:hypothetical protein P0R31_06185 [Bradyrhizobium yuanmingense]|uniref:hypothetical protein n=1 Tax=Bradyrhizobium yuanmingense TaxID=108015 RepID=UPI0023B95C0A|nr:hypothetical protein [Bradyrhizobium yuanmingense]MDF0516816.1 hypothetical protein [Bradyrhizobium yuanmingense]